MHTNTSSFSALSISTTVGVILFGAILFVWKQYPVPEYALRNMLLLAILALVTLVSVVAYQIFHGYESAQILAKSIIKNKLTYSHELFLELYRNSPVPYLVLTMQGDIESANFAAARLFNVKIEELTNVNVFDELIIWEESPKAELIRQYFSLQKFVNDVEVLVRKPNGDKRWVLLSLFSFPDPDGSRKGMLTLIDITKQKQIDKAKTEFVSLASHQLRTPISAMRWNIELLAYSSKESLTTLQSAYVEKISRGLVRMDALVEDFLSASKLELGTLTAKYSTFELAPFFKMVYDEYIVTAEKRGVSVETNWDMFEESYTSDTHLLNMIVSNILGNAIKYTKKGGVVRAILEHSPSHLIITIADSGIGIPKEDQAMIFSKLFRASNAQTQETDGTGLGLYIVQEAAHILGGNVSFVSEEGVGTTFTITLPA